MHEQLREITRELTAPGAPFEVHTVTIEGQARRAYKNAPENLHSVWLATRGFADRDYLVYRDERRTYADTHREVKAVAAGLSQRFGVGPGERVAIAMRNYPEWIISYWATVSLGATVVGMNAWWTATEMDYALSDSQPAVLIADRERLDRFSEGGTARSEIAAVAVRCDAPGALPWSELANDPAEEMEVSIDPDSDACIFYTSGTTGHPKGAQLTHRGCTNNIMSMAFWNAAAPAAMRAAGRDRTAAQAENLQPAFLVVTPLFHVTACNCVMHGGTLSGAKLVLMYKWDPLAALELIERERVTTLSGVPVMSRELITHPRFEDFDTTSLKSLGGGGAAIQPDLVEKIDRRVASARPGTGYGMTETCGVIAMNSADFFIDKPHTAGPLLPSFEGRIVDDGGRDVPAGSPGELWVRGAQVVRGYLNRPDATAETITDGWLHTGDIATMDEHGFIAIVDRAKDMVLRGGENVYCAEVEAAIFAHADIAECVVFGVPDDRLGEEVGAAVVLAPEATLDASALRDFLRQRIAAFKIPRYLWMLRDALPRNASGKFLKRTLRDSLDPADAV